MNSHFIFSLLFVVPFIGGPALLHAEDDVNVTAEWAMEEAEAVAFVEENLPEDIAEQLVERLCKNGSRNNTVLYPLYPLSYHQIAQIFSVIKPEMVQESTSYAKTEPLILLEEGTYMRLKDDSIWQIREEDASLVAQWQVGDFVSFSRNDGWISNGKFSCYMFNQNTDESIQVILRVFMGPAESGSKLRPKPGIMAFELIFFLT